MTGKSDTTVYDKALDVYRVRTSAGAILGTEMGGPPLAFDTRAEAEEHIELRAERAVERSRFLSVREQLGFRP